MDGFLRVNFDPEFQIFPDRIEFTGIQIDSGAYGVVEKAYFTTVYNKKVKIAVKTVKGKGSYIMNH